MKKIVMLAGFILMLSLNTVQVNAEQTQSAAHRHADIENCDVGILKSVSENYAPFFDDWKAERKKNIQKADELTVENNCNFYVIVRDPNKTDNLPEKFTNGITNYKNQIFFHNDKYTFIIIPTLKNFKNIILLNDVPGWLNPGFIHVPNN